MSQREIALQMQGMRVEVSGLRETLQAMELAGAASEDMRDLMHSTGEIVARRARERVGVRSGRLKASIRAGRGKTKAVVRAGTPARAPYAAWAHYGVPVRNIKETMFLVKSLDEVRAETTRHIEKGISDLLRKNRLI